MEQDVTIPKAVKGRKSVFFDDPAIDQLMTFITELLTELSVLRDRVDTLEQLLEDRAVVTRADIEHYVHDDAGEHRRAEARKALLERVIRIEP